MRIFAENFNEAGRRCGDVGGHWPFLAEMVNYAFACEVALKGLLLLNGKPGRGHDLKSLYDRLPEETQVRIRGPELSQEGMKAALQRDRYAFERWRYGYEDKHLLLTGLGFLQSFARSCIAVLVEQAAQAERAAPTRRATRSGKRGRHQGPKNAWSADEAR